MIIFVAPGQSVESATHAFQVSLPYVAAINTAVCSFLVTISLIDEVRIASRRSRFSSQGTQKIYSIACHSKHETNNCAAFIWYFIRY